MLRVQTLPTEFVARPYQQNLINAFFKPNPCRRAYIVWHRRSGKDLTSWITLILKALQRRGTYYYLFPTARQARKALWLGIGKTGISFLDYIPDRLIDKINNTEMRVHLINKSVIQLIGAASYNYAMGTNPVGLVFSEFALQSPLAYTYLLPIITENGGWCILNTTPRGHNHAYKLFEQVKNNQNWYTSTETVATTVSSIRSGKSVVSSDDVKEAKAGGMSYELIAQEFLCSWASGLETAYFAKYIARSRAQGRIKMLPRIHKTIFTFWDLGVKDPTAIFFVAFDEQNFFIMDYYENTRLGMEHYIEYVRRYQERHNCVFGGHFAPHDMKVQEYSTGETRLDFARKQGINFKVVPKPKSKMHAIDVLRGIFDLFYFNRPKCERVFDCLMQYHATINSEGGEAKPAHDWSSNCLDAMQLISQAYIANLLPIKASVAYKKYTFNEAAFDFIAPR